MNTTILLLAAADVAIAILALLVCQFLFRVFKKAEIQKFRNGETTKEKYRETIKNDRSTAIFVAVITFFICAQGFCVIVGIPCGILTDIITYFFAFSLFVGFIAFIFKFPILAFGFGSLFLFGRSRLGRWRRWF